MNILLIGNGFDLAHGLATRYKDFLDYVESKENDQSKKMKKNIWINGFMKRKKVLGENWIDIESEIAHVIKSVEKQLVDRVNSAVNINEPPELAFYLEHKKLGDHTKLGILQLPNKDLITLLINEMNDLICYLERYLAEICPSSLKFISPDVQELEIDRILTFNYTNTYEDVYQNTVEYDFIHGRIGNIPNNMVLGIDEYLSDAEKNTELDFVRFKKYFQRIQKRTGCTYKLWIEQIRKSRHESHCEPVYYNGELLGYKLPPDVNLYIFGHSLDLTDKDILSELILEEGVCTTIFYQDDESYAQKITNLIKIIGQDNVIQFVHGASPKIKFQVQQEMIPAQISVKI